MSIKDFAPVSGGWKPWLGLVIVIVLVSALAVKFGVSKKAQKIVGG